MATRLSKQKELPVGFHAKRGRYVKLSPDNLTAKRDGDTYDNGVCFSQKPLKIGEVFQLKIEEMDLKWAGSLRLGVTTCNPESSALDVVRATTDLFNDESKDFWILSGTRLHHGCKEDEYCLNLHNLEVDSQVGVQVTDKGHLVYYSGGTCMGIAACDIPTKKPVYGVFDIYGRTKVISKASFKVESLEDLCIKTVKKLVKDEDMEKLLLPQCVIHCIRQRKTST